MNPRVFGALDEPLVDVALESFQILQYLLLEEQLLDDLQRTATLDKPIVDVGLESFLNALLNALRDDFQRTATLDELPDADLSGHEVD